MSDVYKVREVSQLVSFFIFFQKTLPSLKICGGRVEVYYHRSKSRKEVIIRSQISVNSHYFKFDFFPPLSLLLHRLIFNKALHSFQHSKHQLSDVTVNNTTRQEVVKLHCEERTYLINFNQTPHRTYRTVTRHCTVQQAVESLVLSSQ